MTDQSDDVEAEFPPEMNLVAAEELPVTEGPGGVPATEDGMAAAHGSRNDPSVRERASRNGFVDAELAPPPRTYEAGSPSDQIELELRGRVAELEHWQQRQATTLLLLAGGSLVVLALIWMLSRKPPLVTP
jgi:hypothetical protein